MSATVLHLSDYRAVFVLPEGTGTVVFLASRGSPPKIAHERRFDALASAMGIARELSTRFGCSIIAPRPAAIASGEDAA